MTTDTTRHREEAVWLPDHDDDLWPSAITHHDITRRRVELYDAMQQLEAAIAIASGWRGWLDGVSSALDVLDETLATHVAEVEAVDGLFDEIVDHAPRMAAAVAEMKRDHGRLTEAAGRAREAVDRSPLDALLVRRRVNGVLARLAEHRQLGAELLYDTYMVDLGYSE